VAHSLGGIVLKYVRIYSWSDFFPNTISSKALIHASSASRGHLSDHKGIEISTYGIIFLGTPHQGSESVDLGLLLLQIQSIYSHTNDAMAKHLRRDSEMLQQQLSQYSAISGKFNTKFFFEAYPTLLPGGIRRVVSILKLHLGLQQLNIVNSACPKVFCCCPGNSQRRSHRHQQGSRRHGKIRIVGRRRLPHPVWLLEQYGSESTGDNC
jgi:hypothetical protein